MPKDVINSLVYIVILVQAACSSAPKTDNDPIGVIEAERNEYFEAIHAKVSGNWQPTKGVTEVVECEVAVVQSSVGKVLDVTFLDCPGSQVYKQAVESAILDSEPLPVPKNRKLFSKKILFKFKPK